MTGRPETYADGAVTIHHGDCLDVLRALPDNSVHAVVTDPPYGLSELPLRVVVKALSAWLEGDRTHVPDAKGFMGRSWDAFVPPPAVWDECYRVLRPGGHVLAFAGSRTHDLMSTSIRLAGFEKRDSIAWLYGSGFPKSLDVGKAIDKAAGVEREVTGMRESAGGRTVNPVPGNSADTGLTADAWRDAHTGVRSIPVTAPATDAARQWAGWGTALKPSHEPVICARKPAGHNAILAEIGSHLDRLESECRRHASDAEPSSAPSPHDSREVKTASALAPVATQRADVLAMPTATGKAADSSAAMATSPSESAGVTYLNTVTSWRACWVELCDLMSTFTTSTTSSQTTDLRTLSSCLSRITLDDTAQNTHERELSRSLVLAADNLFGASVLSLRSTLALSATAPAIASTQPARPDAEGPSAAFEPIVVARKPLAGTVAANVQAWGTGALNIDATRVATDDFKGMTSETFAGTKSGDNSWNREDGGIFDAGRRGGWLNGPPAGRWPANVALDGDMADALDEQSGNLPSQKTRTDPSKGTDVTESHLGGLNVTRSREYPAESGGASRYFPTFRYQAKAPTRERPKVDGVAHPTVKPLELMRWLVRLVTPPGGVVLEPFAGSGTTVEACLLEGFDCVAIEREADYLPLIRARVERAVGVRAAVPPVSQLGLFGDDGDAA